MIKFSFWKYELIPRSSLNALTQEIPRPGCLLKIEWPLDQLVGYADLYPWPEFGDEPLDKHLEGLKKGRISALVEQSIWLARRDAELRKEGKSGLTESRKIKNHFTIVDITKLNESTMQTVKNQGFTTLKVKMGRDPSEEAKWIERSIRKYPYINFRLDFGGNKDFSVFERVLVGIPKGMKQHIEFCEDPVPYSLEAWREAARLAPLAVDFEFSKVDFSEPLLPFRTVILKPARQDVGKMVDLVNKNNLRLVVTNSMDHPVGSAHALRVACEIKKVWPGRIVECGCLTSHLYYPEDFGREMIFQGPCLVQVPGTGIGFDQLLETRPWTALR